MKPWKLIDQASIPGEESAMSLHQRDQEFSIRVDGLELMNSRMHGSEDALAELACKRLGPAPRVLIGGLGMGFTLAAALKQVQSDAVVEVAELVPAVIQWNQGPIGHLAGNPLDDSRSIILEGDVGEIIKTNPGTYSAILLDVDNGPDGLTRSENDRLYGLHGLAVTRDALKSGGILAVWSAGPDPAFTKRLKQSGFQVEEKKVHARQGKKGARHTIWIAKT